MTATTRVPGRAPVVGSRTVAELARAEARYVLRSPVLWLGVAVYAGTACLPEIIGRGGSGTGGDVYTAHQYPAGALAMAAFLVAVWAAQRERPLTTAEMFVNTPAQRWERTAGLLGAAAVPFGLALLIGLVQAVVIRALGGLSIGTAPRSAMLNPTPLELLGPPLAVACSFVAGVAVVRVVRSRGVSALLGVVGGAFLFMFFWIWYYVPFALVAVHRTALVSRDLGMEPTEAELDRFVAAHPPDEYTPGHLGLEQDLGYYGLHLLFVAGLTAALAGLALLRSGSDRRSWRILVGGLGVAVLAVLGELLFVEGARVWGGFL